MGDAAGAPFVRELVERAEVESTSDLARALVEAGGVGLPLLVRAGRQTRGRGRGSNAWWSDPGSLTFTLALDPAAHGLRAAHEPKVALAAAVAVVDAVARHLPPSARPGIRWPNDVEAGGRKLAGILPERVEAPAGPRLLVGVGLNVRTRLDDAPPAVRALAASLADWGAAPTLDDALRDWLDRFAAVVPRLAADDPALAARWAALDTLLGQPVRIDLGTRLVAGVGRGVDADGALRVEAGGGVVRVFGGRVLRDA